MCHLALTQGDNQNNTARIVLERRLASWLLSDEDN
jgi:hypothetical protein